MLINRIQNFIVTTLLIISALAGGYYLGVRGYEVKIKTDIRDIKVINRDIPSSIEIINKESEYPDTVDFTKFWTIWDEINKKHVKKPLNPEKLLDGAIHGMVNAIGDPYTSYFNIEENKQALDSLNGKYEGIGAQLGYDENKYIIVQTPLKDSPAQAAGILAGDHILKIDDKDTAGMTIEGAVGLIRGQAGTSVTLSIFRQSFKEPKSITITRQTIKIDSVKWEDKGSGIVYLGLSRFGETTNTEWDKAIGEIMYQVPSLKAVVLDVRDNPGGYLESAVHISSEFVQSGVIVTEEISDGSSNEFKVSRPGKLTSEKIKVYVLINEGSASAAEIVTGALKERRNAVVVGKRSFGKGSVQKSLEYQDGSALHVTIAKWLTPARNWIDKYNADFDESKYNEKDKDGKEIKGGIKPDHEVTFTDQDVIDKKDVQLDRALELINAK